MRHLIYIFLLTIFSSCQESDHQIIEPELKEFNNHLGHDKAAVLNKAVNSFENFLKNNFPDQDEQQERLLRFLQLISNDEWPNPNWKLQTEANKEILEEFETSGLRKEFRLYGYEEDPNRIEEEIIPITHSGKPNNEPSIDSVGYFRALGLFRISLAESSTKDSLIMKYVGARRIGNLPYENLAEGLLANNISYSNPIHKRIMIIDFYYDLMKWDVERKNKKRHANNK